MEANIQLPIYIVDAFTKKPFAGNPAAVCLVSSKNGLTKSEMQQIANEMNLSETAFVITDGSEKSFQTDSKFNLCWFTPIQEINLCGHATLASASVLFKCMDNKSKTLNFMTLSGNVSASRNSDESVILDFPRNDPYKLNEEKIKELANIIKATITNLKYQEVWHSPKAQKLLIRIDDSYTRNDLEEIKPSIQTLSEISRNDMKGVIVTLKGTVDNGCIDEMKRPYDFISRYFAPWVGISEDPVTGSAHTVLGPYWAQTLSKTELFAYQCSKRGGELHLVLEKERIKIIGNTKITMNGKLNI